VFFYDNENVFSVFILILANTSTLYNIEINHPIVIVMIGGVYHRKAHSDEIAEYHKVLNEIIMDKFPDSFNRKYVQYYEW